MKTEKETTPNSTFAIGGFSYSPDSFVLARSFVLRTNICAKNPRLLQYPNRCVQYEQNATLTNTYNKCRIKQI